MILISIYLWDKKQALIFFIVSFFLMLVLAFNFYGLNFWHSYFFFIYLIISLWIADKKDDGNLEIRIAVEKAINKLTTREQQVLNERFVIGKTQMEIADEIGISQAQVSRLEKRAIKQLKKVLK